MISFWNSAEIIAQLGIVAAMCVPQDPMFPTYQLRHKDEDVMQGNNVEK